MTHLTWKPPTLVNPISIEVSDANRSLSLDPKKDYKIHVTSPITKIGGLSITGGHNYTLIGGEVHFTDWLGADHGKANRGLYLKSFTGTAHVEGLHLSGILGEGWDIDTRTNGATVQLENIRVDPVLGSQTTNHADIGQNWAGPTTYRIDGLTGSTNYQGLFLQSQMYGLETQLCDFRRVNLHGLGSLGRYLIYRTGGSAVKINLQDFYCQPGTKWANESGGYSPTDPMWKNIKHGSPVGGDFVPATLAGMHYVSPGYV